jgi:hypothetical protein
MTENQKATTIPADGIKFELTLATIDPIQMIQNDGHDPRGWRFGGSQVNPQTRCFQLVRVDYGQNFIMDPIIQTVW